MEQKNQLTIMMFIKVMNISLHVSCDPTITRKEKEIYFAQSIITSTTYLYQEMLPPLYIISSSEDCSGYSVYHFNHKVYTHSLLLCESYFKINYP